MAVYFNKIENTSKLTTRSGNDAVLPLAFSTLAATIIRQTSFLQSNIQRIIYISHGSELLAAKQALKNNPSPKTRMEFISSFPYDQSDPVISTVFNYSRKLFLDIYELRNILAHENWMSSEDFKDAVLFSELNEEIRLMIAGGQLVHEKETTPRIQYEAIIRYIESCKIVTVKNLQDVLRDANLCSWILMTISHHLGESNPKKKEDLRKSFFLFKGTSHLFDEVMNLPETICVESSAKKGI